MKIAVLGAGIWGTTMAIYLAKQADVSVTLLCRDAAILEELRSSGENRKRLPGVPLGKVALGTLDEPMEVDMAIMGVPSHATADVLERCKVSSPYWVSLAKGIILETLTTPCELIETTLRAQAKPFSAVWSLAGPAHAGSVAAGLPCAMVLSGADGEGLMQAQQTISSTQMRIYGGTDRRGAELGGALKNAFAVAAGLCDGLKMGDNAKAALLTRALSEMIRLGIALGGSRETFFGLTGAGDLMATSYGQWSRNRQLGEAVANGSSAAALMEKVNTAEGYRASMALRALARKKQIEAPILEEVAAILHEGRSALESISRLMDRPLKKE